MIVHEWKYALVKVVDNIGAPSVIALLFYAES